MLQPITGPLHSGNTGSKQPALSKHTHCFEIDDMKYKNSHHPQNQFHSKVQGKEISIIKCYKVLEFEQRNLTTLKLDWELNSDHFLYRIA
jgi:hypothetical protein